MVGLQSTHINTTAALTGAAFSVLPSTALRENIPLEMFCSAKKTLKKTDPTINGEKEKVAAGPDCPAV